MAEKVEKPTLHPLLSVELLIFLLGLALRLFAAASRTDAFWPDEHFQTLEPAGSVVFGHGFMSWEWMEGYRSWILPSVYIPLLWICKLFGVHGGIVPIYACRIFTAAVSSCVILALDRTLRLLHVETWPRRLALALFALSPMMVLWGASTLGDNWLMIALWLILPAVIVRSESKSPRSWFFMGLLLGLPTLVKLQSAFWLGGVALVFLGKRTRVPLLLAGFAGFACVFLFYGAVDWITLGSPYHSLIQQYIQGADKAKFYGVSDDFDYFRKVVEDRGVFLVGGIGLALAAAFAWTKGRKTLRGTFRDSRFWMLTLPFVTLFACLSLIAHKETRFLLPIFPLLYAWLAIGLNALGKLRLPEPATSIAAGVVLAGAAALAAPIAVHTPIYLTSKNISDLEDAIYRDGGLAPDGHSCLLLLEHNWSWSRGYLVLGAPARYVDTIYDHPGPAEYESCAYAIVPIARATYLDGVMPDHRWEWVKNSPSGYSLYKNTKAR